MLLRLLILARRIVLAEATPAPLPLSARAFAVTL